MALKGQGSLDDAKKVLENGLEVNPGDKLLESEKTKMES